MPALVFDFDGLMIDSERVLAAMIIEVVVDRGGAVTIETFGHLLGSTAVDHEWDRLVPTWCDPPITLAELDALVWPRVHKLVDRLPLLPGVADLIKVARSLDWNLALATGHTADRLYPRLDRLGVLRDFDAIVLASEVALGKPAPDIFMKAADRLGLLPKDCVVLEDSLAGCEAAIAAGMAVVVCPSPVTAHLEFPEAAWRVPSLKSVCPDDLEPFLQSVESA